MYKKAIDKIKEKDNLISQHVSMFFHLEDFAEQVKAKEATSTLQWVEDEDDVPVGEYVPEVVFKVRKKVINTEESSKRNEAIDDCKEIVMDWLIKHYDYDAGDEVSDELFEALESLKETNEVITDVKDLDKIKDGAKIKKLTITQYNKEES